ncbi:MAG: hypothetical protein JSS02_19265, partial [Planctomycetes bacterium]|nr:hypothetical protein [Planctomycetota bacterium]
RFLNIGDEGNDDFYCMVGNDVNTDELWAWLHDSFATPLFIRCNDEESVRYREKLGLPLGTTLREYLSGEWVLVRQADPFTEMSDGSKTICRANHPLRGILNPIRLQEWRDYIARFSQFEFDEFVKATVLGKKRRLHLWPGRVKWNLGETWVHINYMHGCLTVSPDAAGSLTNVQLKTLRGFARDLNAKLL